MFIHQLRFTIAGYAFHSEIRLSALWRPAAGNRGAGARYRRRRQGPGAARHHRQRQDFHRRQRDPGDAAAHAGHRAQQDAGRAALSGISTLFPENAVEYFVSYYDYYQPEAYVPRSDTYIEKDAIVNEDIDRLRMSATRALFERRDVIVVASVSCIYGLGDPDAYYGMLVFLEPGMRIARDTLLQRLVELQYERNDIDFKRGSFRVRGDVVEIYPSYQDEAYRIELWGDEIDSISTIDPLLGEVTQKHTTRLPLYPKSHYVMPRTTLKRAIKTIKQELEWWEPKLIEEGKLLEAQRLHQRTMFDMEMMKEMGFCRGIENYSRHLTGKKPGEPPPTLLDYLPRDTMVVIDESHQTIPQVRGMFFGDQSRKKTLVEYGFRLPSALDNRPLNFESSKSASVSEFMSRPRPGHTN